MTIERILISKQEMCKVEAQIRFQAHIMRYAAVRRFIYGDVIDFACGCGYGTHLLSMSPEVTSMLGVDKDKESVEWAKKEFTTDNCSYLCDDITSLKVKCDTLVSLETIEHFKNDEVYHKVVKNCAFDQLIISYPNKKSSGFNKFHKRDINLQEVCDAFMEDYLPFHYFTLGDVDIVIFIRKPVKLPSHIYRNIVNLR